MFETKRSVRVNGIQKEIDHVLRAMADENPDSEKYSEMADQLVKLHALRENEKPKRLSPDTLLTVIGQLFGIMAIVGHERTNVVTSKAMNLLQKPK